MTAEARRGLLLVMIDVDSQHEDEFNRWYDEEHFPERVNCPGFRGARRWRVVDGAPRYLALYEVDDVGVLDSPDYAEIAAASPRTAALAPHMRVTRNVYEDITPTEIPPVVERLAPPR